jgi:hypothetical protein
MLQLIQDRRSYFICDKKRDLLVGGMNHARMASGEHGV